MDTNQTKAVARAGRAIDRAVAALRNDDTDSAMTDLLWARYNIRNARGDY
jgi:hypothetical protein